MKLYLRAYEFSTSCIFRFIRSSVLVGRCIVRNFIEYKRIEIFGGGHYIKSAVIVLFIIEVNNVLVAAIVIAKKYFIAD